MILPRCSVHHKTAGHFFVSQSAKRGLLHRFFRVPQPLFFTGSILQTLPAHRRRSRACPARTRGRCPQGRPPGPSMILTMPASLPPQSQVFTDAGYFGSISIGRLLAYSKLIDKSSFSLLIACILLFWCIPEKHKSLHRFCPAKASSSSVSRSLPPYCFRQYNNIIFCSKHP